MRRTRATGRRRAQARAHPVIPRLFSSSFPPPSGNRHRAASAAPRLRLRSPAPPPPSPQTPPSVAPDLIWGPNPTLCAVRGPERSCQCRSQDCSVAWRCKEVGFGFQLSLERRKKALERRKKALERRAEGAGTTGGRGYTPSSVAPALPRQPASAPFFVAPDLIWGPNPTLCATLRSRATRERRQRMARGLALRRELGLGPRSSLGRRREARRVCGGGFVADSRSGRE